jgi:hypothetical protein
MTAPAEGLFTWPSDSLALIGTRAVQARSRSRATLYPRCASEAWRRSNWPTGTVWTWTTQNFGHRCRTPARRSSCRTTSDVELPARIGRVVLTGYGDGHPRSVTVELTSSRSRRTKR